MGKKKFIFQGKMNKINDNRYTSVLNVKKTCFQTIDIKKIYAKKQSSFGQQG
jgi:hypothetical protein